MATKQAGKKHMNLHAETSSHAMNIYSQAIGSKGGNKLEGAPDDFATPADGQSNLSRGK